LRMERTLAGLFRNALRQEVHIADVLGTEDRSGSDLLKQADAMAAGLRHHGLLADEPVYVRVGNRPGDLAAMLGVWLAGGVAVPVHSLAAPHTIELLGKATGARLALEGDAVEVIGHSPPPRRALLDDAALIVFTSGTTGSPKGVVISHAALAGKIEVLERLLGIQATDVVLLPLHLTFIFGIWVAALTLRSGARLVLVPKFSRQAVETGLSEGVTVLAAVPSMLRTLLAVIPPAAPALRMILTGGEALGPSLNAKLMQAWSAGRVYDLYGSTETGSCDFWHTPGRGEEGSIGTPTSNVLYRILDENGNEVYDRGVGELCIRTSYGMAGYLDNPELTRASFEAGYYRTGDLARAGADGSVSLVGRLKELVSSGGNKIAPQEIDNLLTTHPDVSASLSAGRPDGRLGETLHSVVVLSSNATVTAGGLREWLSERVERFKLPKTIQFVGELPTGPTGKASRAALRDLLLLQFKHHDT